jgi:hypothetical protein
LKEDITIPLLFKNMTAKDLCPLLWIPSYAPEIKSQKIKRKLFSYTDLYSFDLSILISNE